jgi:MYXO-CTERM domain-containing protein
MSPLLLLLIPQASADTLTVDAGGGGMYTTIQAAVDAAGDGDILSIASGTYNENVSISAKNVTLQGVSSDTVTVIGDSGSATLTIDDSNVHVWGVALMDGQRGVVIRNGDLELDDVIAQNNGGAATGGGVAILDGATATILASDISGNNAGDGGGIYLEDGTTAEISDTTISSNTATGNGGGISSAGSLKLTACTVSDNVADGDGGGVYAAAVTPDFWTTDFFSNEGDRGGAIYLDGTSTGSISPRLKECDLAYNRSSGVGGAVAISGTTEFYLNLTVAWMNEADGNGGALYAENVSLLKLTYARFFYNTGTNGGGMYATGLGGGETRRSRFGGNSASGNGGGAYYADPAGSHPVHNNIYIENSASQGGGLAISGDASKWHTVENIDAAGNAGDGIAILASAQGKVVNANAFANTGAGLRVDSESVGGGTFKNNDSSGNDTDWGGGLSDLSGTDGNISADPLYQSYAADGNPISDFLYLDSASPCIDAGKADLTDVDGSISDIGSYGGLEAEAGDDDGDGTGPSGGDCDDGDPAVGTGGTEVWYDGRDNDCGGGDDFDQDGDGYRYGQGDCDDTDGTVFPGADDPPGDGVDQDCDGSDSGSDSGDPPTGDDTGTGPGADTGAPWVNDEDTGGDPFADADNDGFVQGEDCNDADPDANPDADEVCDDGVDNDCDGKADDEDADCMGGSKGCKCATTAEAPALSWLLALSLGVLLRRRQEP